MTQIIFRDLPGVGTVERQLDLRFRDRLLDDELEELSPLFDDPVMKMVRLSVGAFGVFAVLPVFFGPFVMGALKDATGDYAAGLWVIAACAVVAMLFVLALHHDRRLEEAPAGAAAE